MSPHRPPLPPAPSPPAGESAFLDWVRRRQAGRPSPGVVSAAGDDLAVLDWPGGLVLLGVDPVLDGVHLDLAQCGPAAAGRKAMNRNLSDVAAMAGTPVAATLSLVVPHALGGGDVRAIYAGAEAAGDAFACPIVGGDFASWDGRLVVTVGILARCLTPVARGTARAGQRLYVTGPLGGSILGRHLTFTPRIDLGHTLAASCRPSAMMDLSDGLTRDLPRLLGHAGVGATLDAAAIPVHDDARRLAAKSGRDPLWHALNDGEDYELLFAADAMRSPRLRRRRHGRRGAGRPPAARRRGRSAPARGLGTRRRCSSVSRRGITARRRRSAAQRGGARTRRARCRTRTATPAARPARCSP